MEPDDAQSTRPKTHPPISTAFVTFNGFIAFRLRERWPQHLFSRMVSTYEFILKSWTFSALVMKIPQSSPTPHLDWILFGDRGARLLSELTVCGKREAFILCEPRPLSGPSPGREDLRPLNSARASHERSRMIGVTAGMKIREVLEINRRMIEACEWLAPGSERLCHPHVSRFVAGRVSVQQAARIARVPLSETLPERGLHLTTEEIRDETQDRRL